jgi:hypothetical protein
MGYSVRMGGNLDLGNLDETGSSKRILEQSVCVSGDWSKLTHYMAQVRPSVDKLLCPLKIGHFFTNFMLTFQP